MEEEVTESKEQERQVQALRTLRGMEPFKLWRDLVVEPTIKQLEIDMANPMELTEANLKAKVMHLNSLKYLFKDVFEQIDAQIELTKENNG